MTIRAKVLLFALMAVGLVCLMGVNLYVGISQGRLVREQISAIQDQLDGYDRLHGLVRPYLSDLAEMRQVGGDTGLVRRELLKHVEGEMGRLAASMAREDQSLPGRSHEAERREREELHQALRAWAEWAEARMSTIPPGTPVGSTVEWLLYTEFEQDVGHRLTALKQSKQAQLAELRLRWDQTGEVGLQLAVFIPALCVVLVLALALAILVPMRRSLRGLMAVAERIGQGDFDVRADGPGHDELGMLARAIDRMAGALRESLAEKQQLLRAEAETAEREARRYHTLLEETVHTRTAELAEANARLQDSLQQLQAAQEQLLFADRLASVGRLAAGVGHEINNPLAFILSNLRFIQRELKESHGAPSEEDRKELLAAIAEANEGAERVRLIVRDLRTLSRPDDLAVGPVEVAEVVRSAAKMANHEVRERARLVEECGGVPPVRANAVRLGQVFLNLFINAAHAIPSGRQEENEIRVVARCSGPGKVTVEVRDTGSGIPHEHLRRIFDPFFTTKPAGVGTGLGLSVCHRIITALGGEIHVESEPGRGTCFSITLPSCEDAAASSGQPAA